MSPCRLHIFALNFKTNIEHLKLSTNLPVHIEETHDLVHSEVGVDSKALCQILLLLFHPQRYWGKRHLLLLMKQQLLLGVYSRAI